jgi:hypothetical protein
MFSATSICRPATTLFPHGWILALNRDSTDYGGRLASRSCRKGQAEAMQGSKICRLKPSQPLCAVGKIFSLSPVLSTALIGQESDATPVLGSPIGYLLFSARTKTESAPTDGARTACSAEAISRHPSIFEPLHHHGRSCRGCSATMSISHAMSVTDSWPRTHIAMQVAHTALEKRFVRYSQPPDFSSWQAVSSSPRCDMVLQPP